MQPFLAFVLTTLSGVFVSLISLSLAARQRAKEETRMEEQRRESILSAIGAELRWNRRPFEKTLDVTNAHLLVGAYSSVAFERHGADLVTIAPDTIEYVYKHYAEVGKAREGIRALVGIPDRDANQKTFGEWIGLCDAVRVDVPNSASDALRALQLPLTDM